MGSTSAPSLRCLDSLPVVVCHADWSASASKRWHCLARKVDATYVVDVPRPVGELSDFVDRLCESRPDGRVLIGFDFPIGLPIAYARGVGIQSFRDALPGFGRGSWSTFYELAERVSDISPWRPFYPARPGGTSHAQLIGALRVSSMNDLRRQCERKTDHRGNACSLFWTLGGNQVGRAAISGWREILAPAVERLGERIGLWPFDGDLTQLLHRKRVVIAETYPAEACVHLGMSVPGRKWSKRRQRDRIVQGERLQTAAREWGLTLTPQLSDSISEGFGCGTDGEDKFDAVVGLLSMLSVVRGSRAEGAPTSREIRMVEGWILGQ